jgi:hypothetical protein
MIPIVKVITRQKNVIIPSIFSLKRKDYLLITAIALCGAVIAPTLYFFGLKQALASNASVLLNVLNLDSLKSLAAGIQSI